MLRSLFSGISGLRAHQTMMDVVSNNIANVNTAGYKSSSVLFEDTLSQMMRASAASTATAGGLNPTQVGLGVQVAGIQTNFVQGSTQTTGKATDLQIQGDGFFVMKNGNEQVYSRAGGFTLDANGDLMNNEGMYVMGYAATDGAIASYGTLSKISMPTGSAVPGSATDNVTLGGNLSPIGTTALTVTATVYDQNGAAHALPITFTPHDPADGQYDVEVLDPDDNTNALVTGALAAFDAAGAFDATASTAQPLQVTLNSGEVIDLDLTQLTGYSGTSSPTVKTATGYASGTLTQFQIGNDGTVTGIYSNSQKQALGQIALATFNNPAGLERLGQSTYRSSANSGLAQIGVASAGGRGTMVSGALEMSNVDLGAEFTNLIIAQRGFQANSKVITASDEMLQDLINVKR
jgi:flagellar hook protein FlgE